MALKCGTIAHKRIKTDLDGKFSHKTKKVLYLRMLYSDVTLLGIFFRFMPVEK